MNKRQLLGAAPLLSLVFAVSLVGAQEPPEPQTSTAESEAEQSAAPAVAKPKTRAEIAPTENRFAGLLNRPSGLTSAEAARKAADYSKDAQVAKEEYKAADATVTKTIYNYAPRLTLQASYTRQSLPDTAVNFGSGNLVATSEPPGALGADPPLFAIDGELLNFSPVPNNYRLSAGLVVPISDYLLNMSQALSGANAAKETALINERAARLTAAANAKLSYYDWVRVRLRVAETESAIARAQAQLDNLKKLQAGGRVARADVLRQDAFLANVELQLRRNRTQEAVARERLHVQMTGGEGPTPAWEIGEDIMSVRRGDVVTEDTQTLHDEARAQRLEILALQNTAYALSQKASVQRSQGYPRVEGFGEVIYANPNPIYQPPQAEWNASWNVGVRLTWTVNDLGSNFADAKSTDAEIAKVNAQKQQVEDTLRTEVLTARSSLEEASLARESARRGVEAAEAAYTDRALLFENGRATSLDVLQAEDALVSARMNLVDAYVEVRIAKVRLDHAVGRDIQEGLGVNQK